MGNKFRWEEDSMGQVKSAGKSALSRPNSARRGKFSCQRTTNVGGFYLRFGAC